MFHIHKSNRVENLVDALAGLLRNPPPSPLMPEWIGIQTQGIGVWLGMEISRRLGIWANVRLPFPRALIESLLRLVLGEQFPETALFSRDALVWSILSLLPQTIDQDEFKPLKNYLSDDPHGLKRLQLAERIAHLFDQYSVYRYDTVLAWENEPRAAKHLPPELRWQPLLWKALTDRYGPVHLPAAANRFSDALAAGNFCRESLPHRISLFGISTLPPLFVHILGRLSEIVPIHLFALSPSREYWADVRSKKELWRIQDDRLWQEGPEALYFEEGHPLLSSLGKLGRDFQRTLENAVDYVDSPDDLYEDPARRGRPTLLEWVQSDMLNLRRRGPGAEAPMAVDAEDHSITVHACHSAMREVQVLRDRLLDIFAIQPEIQPRDVIVMAPMIDAYAPFIEAVFAAGDHRETIPFSISDRNIRQEAVVVEAFLGLLELSRHRLTLEEVLDLMALDPVRGRFGLSSRDVATAWHWFKEAGVRWGIDAQDRLAAGQPGLDQNTWQFGLDRLLLGYAMPGEHCGLFGDTAPYDRIEGREAQILGQAAAFCQALFDGLRRLDKAARTLSQWRKLLNGLLKSLVAETPENAHQHQLIRSTLLALEEDGLTAGFDPSLSLAAIRHLLAERLTRTPSERGFLSGGVTFCNFLPMRSIPFKVVGLLGMSDTGFPRSQPVPGFDLMCRNPRPGDRSLREDDRYLFLEALMSARERLVVTYVGQSIRDNSVIPPSVMVSELLDMIEEGFFPAGLSTETDPFGGGSIKERLLTRHPLQPFNPGYFDARSASLFSYSTLYYGGARTLCAGLKDAPRFMAGPLPPDEARLDAVHLQDLVYFFQNPVKYFLRNRLGVILDDDVESLPAREPMGLEGLERYLLGQRLLQDMVSGRSAQAAYSQLRASGRLPPGSLGRCYFDDLARRADPLAQTVRRQLEGDPLPPLGVDFTVGTTRIRGRIDSLWPAGRVLYTYGGVSPKREIALWISHLLLNAIGCQELACRSRMIAWDDRWGAKVLELTPLPDRAPAILSDLVAAYWQGQSEPLLFFPNASFAYARKWMASDQDREHLAMTAALKQWLPSPWRSMPSESQDPHVRRVFSGGDPLAAENEKNRKRFAGLALRILKPLLSTQIENRIETRDGD